MISFKSSFKNNNVVLSNSKIFFWMAASLAETAAVNPKGTKTPWDNGVSTVFINGNPALMV